MERDVTEGDGTKGARGRAGESASAWSRWVAGVVAVWAAVHVATLLPRVFAIAAVVPSRAQLVVWAIGLTVVTAVAACGLSLLLVARAAPTPAARSMALFLAFLALVWGSILRFLEVEASAEELGLTMSFGGMPLVVAPAALMLAVAAFLRFSVLLSGDHDSTSALGRFLSRPRLIWGLALTLPWLTRLPGWIADLTGLAPSGPDSPGLAWMVRINLTAAALVMGIVPLLGIGAGAVQLHRGYRRMDAAGRGRVLWLVVGLAGAGWLVLVPIGVTAVTGLLDVKLPSVLGFLPFMIALAPTLIVLGAGFAILYSGALDPRLALRRSTVYGLMGALGIALFSVVEGVISWWLEGWLGYSGPLGSIIAGVVAAGILVPLRRSFGRFVRPGPEVAGADRSDSTVGSG